MGDTFSTGRRYWYRMIQLYFDNKNLEITTKGFKFMIINSNILIEE